MPTPVKILIIEHEESDLEFLMRELKKGNIDYIPNIAKTLPEVENLLMTFNPDIVLSDYSLPTFNGFDAFKLKTKIAPLTPFIFVSGYIGEENAVEHIKNGVTDCVQKDKLFTLNTKIYRALAEATDRKEKIRAEAELLKSERRLVHAQHIAKLGSWEADFETGKMIWSDEMYNIYNCNPETFVPNAESLISLLHSDDRDEMGKWMAAMTYGKEQEPEDFRLNTTDDRLKYIRFQGEIIFNENSEPVKVTGTAQDITEKKINEIELQRTVNDLHDKINEQIQFSYIISHNLRAPIANLIGLANIMNIETISTEEKHKIIEQMQYTAIKMDDVIKDLNLILNERTALNTKKEKTSIRDIIASIKGLLADQIKEAGAIIKTNISKDAEYNITIKSYFESIMFNLISNAIKYRSPKRVLKIKVSVKKKNDDILITVKDNGTGIDLEKYGKHVFGLYKRFHPEIEGKGLGLHMTKTQVEALGGKIDILSEPNKGTTFYINFPK